jgi:hypothetical protein
MRKRVALLILLTGIAAVVALLYPRAVEARIKGSACQAMDKASESGQAFDRSSISDQVLFDTVEARAFEADLDEAYETAKESRDRDFFARIIHARGEFLRAKKLVVYGPPSPGPEVIKLSVEWAQSSVELTSQFARSCG